MSPIKGFKKNGKTFLEKMAVFRKQDYTRIQVDNHLLGIEEVIDYNYKPK